MTSRGEHIRLDKGSIVKHHYEVVTSVGSGNFSKVYRVVDLQLPPKEQKRKPLAMKVIKKEYSSDAKYEKQMLIALHKNDKNHNARVSKMYECFVFQECPVFIMPIHGPSIRSRRLGINRGVVTREKLMEFAFDILETMDFVHFQCHMVHTDLKPENILIADSNVAENSMGDEWVVCDFGSASLWRMDKLDSDLISTRPYRAPEVVLGNKWHYAADMWSVGCILYEVAVGHRLFEIRDDLTHLHMMDRRIGRLPEAFTKGAKYSSKFFNARGEFLSTPDVIRFGKCRLTSIRDMFRDDREFLHLLEGLLVYDPSRRMTATEALALPMFDNIKAARERRQQREAEEAEARRQRRRAAAAAAAAAGTGGSAALNATNTGSDSLMSTINSLAGTLNPRVSDQADRNAEEAQKMPRSTLNSADDVTAAAAGKAAPAPNTASRPTTTVTNVTSANTNTSTTSGATAAAANAGLNEDNQGTETPLTDRSAAETVASRVSVQVSPGKEVGKTRSGRSNTGSASPHSATASSGNAVPAGAGTSSTKSGKPRARAVSTPAGLSKSTSSGTAVGGHTASTAATAATTSSGVVTKDVPNQRPVVDNHRASTGSLTPSASTTMVPKLALNRLTAGDVENFANANASTTAKAPRTAGSGGSGSGGLKSSGSGPSERKSSLRTASPATERGAATANSPSSHKSKSSSSHTPRKAGRTSRRESGASSTDEAAASAVNAEKRKSTAALEGLTSVVPHAPDTVAAGPTGLTRNTRGAMTTPASEASRKTPTPPPPPSALQQAKAAPASGFAASPLGDSRSADPATAKQLTSSTIAPTTTSAASATKPATAVTPLRSLATGTPVGHQSPLERGVTAVGMTTRSEAPVDIRSPASEGDEDVKSDAALAVTGEEEEEEGERRTRDPADASEKEGDEDANGDNGEQQHGLPRLQLHRKRGTNASSSSDDEGDDGDGATSGSNLPSPGAPTNPDGSPRATDYRSPVRHRPPVVTPTDDTSGQTSPDARRRSTLYASVSSGEWASMEAAAAAAVAASASTAAAAPTHAASPTPATSGAISSGHVPARTAEKPHPHPFPQTQPAPNLALNSPRSDGHRTPREVSPAPINGRTNSPAPTARRASQQQPVSAAAAAEAGATAAGREHDGHVLASTVPIVRGNSRSNSLVSTTVSSPNPDALARTMGPSSATASATAAALAPAHEGVGVSGAYPAILRSPHGGSSLTPRASTAGARPSIHAAAGALAATTPAPATPTAAVTPGSGATHAAASPSMKPVINVSASLDRLKSVTPSSSADIRGPSAIPVSASRLTVVKPGPASLNNSLGANGNGSSGGNMTMNNTGSGIPEHPISPHTLAPMPAAPHGANGVPHPPDAVARSRERSLVADGAASHNAVNAAAAASTGEREKTAASRRGSTNSPHLGLNATSDAVTPKTPLPSTAASAGGGNGVNVNNNNNSGGAAGAAGANGTTSLSSSLSLPSTSTHPTLGVVRQRSGSTHLIPGHPSTAGGLESNPALTASQLGVYTPRGSRVLQEHQSGVSGRSSATLPSVVTGGNTNTNNHNSGAAPAMHHHHVPTTTPTSPPPPSRGGRTSFSLATPSAAAAGDGEAVSGRTTEHLESRPTTPRGSGRMSMKSLDLQQLHPTAVGSAATGGTRPPRSSISAASTAGPSPAAPAGGSGGKSPRYSAKLGGVSSSHGGQAALNASTGSLHLGVTRSPRKPVAPGAHNNNNNNAAHGSPSLMASVDSVSAISLRSPRSSSRVTTSPRGSGTRKDTSKTVSPRRASLSPRGKATAPAAAAGHSHGSSSSHPPHSSSAVSVAASETASTGAGGVSLSVPMQPLPQQPTPTQPAPGTRLSQPRRSITVISSKPSSSGQLSRYSNVAAVAPTRTSALRPPPTTTTDLMASTGKLSTSNGLNASNKQSAPTSLVASTSTAIAPNSGLNSRQSSLVDTNSNTNNNNNNSNVETGSASGSTGPKYRRDARTLKRIIVQRPSPQSSGTSMVSPQELGEDDASSISPPASTN